MNKEQLIRALADHFDGNRRQAQHALESVVDTVMREVAKGEKVAITGFGAFEKAIRPARMVRNPRTGERTRAKKTAVPKFRAGSELKAVVSGAKKLPKAPAGGTAKKSAARKATAKKSTATRTATASRTAKKGAAQRTTRSTTTAKKSAAQRTTRSTTTAKKSTAKKRTTRSTTTAKKAAAQRTATPTPTSARPPGPSTVPPRPRPRPPQ